jgi:5-(carboxyamino)imidazole ribonucleotide synthase
MQYFSTNFKLGILGGGQLGKMMLSECVKFDIYCIVLDPNEDAPCSNLASEFFVGDLMDYDTVLNFGNKADVITIEIENVNADALEKLESLGKKVYPSSNNIKTIQNKGLQKIFYKENNLPTSDFKIYANLKSIEEDLLENKLNFPFVWKSTQFGYDGKGVKIVENKDQIKELPNLECIVEEKIKIQKELSVIVSRNESNQESTYPIVEMEFNQQSNLVERVICPANIPLSIEKTAVQIAINLSRSLNHIGLLAIEMFLTQDNKVLINEIAPRPHNSGHHTIECCHTSQFEQHLRSILNLPLGDTSIKIPGIMLNLVGENKVEGDVAYENMEKVMRFTGVTPHIYGKRKSRLNRKMGHITIVNKNIDDAIEMSKEIKKIIKVTTK